jgi:hypothetical protein
MEKRQYNTKKTAGPAVQPSSQILAVDVLNIFTLNIWVVTLCLQPQRWGQHVITQKTNINIFTAMRTPVLLNNSTVTSLHRGIGRKNLYTGKCIYMCSDNQAVLLSPWGINGNIRACLGKSAGYVCSAWLEQGYVPLGLRSMWVAA